MDSIFTKIINREIPAYIIEENDDFIAFLDVFPLAKGHTLVIPKKQVDYIFDLDEKTHEGLWAFAKKVSYKVNSAIECKRVGVAVIGLEVPHAHIHLVPLNTVKDINFSQPKMKLDESEFIEIHKKIMNA
ncbi:MAG: HIT domain-containing protein [Vicingaceae bacterium]|nr:HIT domain-containing protein [Vicingaceae bacterium]